MVPPRDLRSLAAARASNRPNLRVSLEELRSFLNGPGSWGSIALGCAKLGVAHLERRQLERQPRAAAGVVGRMHRAAVRLGRLPDDREPETRAGTRTSLGGAIEAV